VNLVHYLIGYDPATERIAAQYPVPRQRLVDIKTVVKADADDPRLAGSYRLTKLQVTRIAGIIGVQAYLRNLDYFFQAFDMPSLEGRWTDLAARRLRRSA